jgi:hypothetical protein
LSTEKKPYDYINHSRGHKTKGNSYKDRYVEVECPECGYHKAYKDEWKGKYAYTCLKRSCRKKWYYWLTPEEKANQQAQHAAQAEANALAELEAQKEEELKGTDS